MTPRLLTAILELYEVFSVYPANRQMHASPLLADRIESWTSDLFAAPLRDLTANQLATFSGKAMTTWGDVDDFKHFLPRILELVAALDPPYWVVVIFEKLEYGNWRSWEKREQEAIELFMYELWKCLLLDDSENAADEFESYFTAIFNEYPGTEKLLTVWESERGKAATKHLANYVYAQQHLLFDRGQRKGGPATQLLINWLLSDAMIARLETAFYEYENEELASTISWAEQILRSQRNRQTL
ncbi:hypothetical protein [Paraflavitalea sp. CAU 1676]|uniref:hypothetical protein n=1 Tax=Paraflavitalea sp. CAU 1676 TaxID=3032598 RepID=UPI0023DA724E|nr:hypothetical protein [Paraflavitalea sp. CAU 1676]MDF2190082.1 hypothetical protein [Paraflavitalea sp. CAU 1676]